MQRLFESTVIRHLVFSPRTPAPVNFVPLCKHRLRYSFASWKHSQASAPLTIRQHLQPFHSTVSRQTMSSATSTFYDLKADLPSDKTYAFDQLKGKVVLIVNVASEWYVSAALVLACPWVDTDNVIIAGSLRSTVVSDILVIHSRRSLGRTISQS